MKLAIATEGSIVSGHFGHCESFTIYEIEAKEVKNKEVVENPGHKPGFLPVFLDEKGVNVIVSGGMGAGAIKIFDEKGIEVITGAEGEVDEILKSYLAGELVSSGSVCNNHEHSGECGNH